MVGTNTPKSKPTTVGVDTNVLLDLARDDETVLDCLATVRKRLPNVQFVVSHTVIQELADIADNGDTAAEREAAMVALTKLVQEWNFTPFNCVPVGNGIVEETGRKLRAKQLLPETELNDSFVIVEAGLIGATLLISSDRHIHEIDWQALKIELDAADISTPLISSPSKIVKNFFS